MTGTVDVVGHNVSSATGKAGEDCTTLGNAQEFAQPTPYDDVKEGATVKIIDATEKVLTITELGGGVMVNTDSDGIGCEFAFTVSDIPAGQSADGVQVGQLDLKVAHPDASGAVTITFGD